MRKAHFILLYIVKHIAESSVCRLIYQQNNSLASTDQLDERGRREL